MTKSRERERLRNTLVSLPSLLWLMIGEVVATDHAPLYPILAKLGLNNRYPYKDQRSIRYSVRPIMLKQKEYLKIKQMDHNTMNFDRKFYQCNVVVKDCNVKPTIPKVHNISTKLIHSSR